MRGVISRLFRATPSQAEIGLQGDMTGAIVVVIDREVLNQSEARIVVRAISTETDGRVAQAVRRQKPHERRRRLDLESQGRRQTSREARPASKKLLTGGGHIEAMEDQRVV
jgi:hypothetical protein